MAMRELVSGGAACAVPGSSSSSNPLGALANALIGSSSKIEVRVLYCNFCRVKEE
jgi:peroxin-5